MIPDLICRFASANKNAASGLWVDVCYIARTLFVRKCPHGLRSYCYQCPKDSVEGWNL